MQSNLSRGFRVAPTSHDAIRAKAVAARAIFGLDKVDWFCLKKFVEGLELFGITYDVVEDTELPRGVEALCKPEERVIYMTESTYRGVCSNDPRTRFTIFHELGHLLLAHNFSFHRDNGSAIKSYENSEWQADVFAAEMLMPLDIILRKQLFSEWNLVYEFHVSHHAACVRLAKLKSWGKI